MTNPNNHVPWYRHRWPWIVIVLLGSAVSASIYTLFLASQGNDSLVIDGTGGTNVVTERNLAAAAAAAEMELEAEIVIDVSSGAVTMTLTNGALDDNPPTLELWLSHPTLADRDQRLTLTTAIPDATGQLRWSGALMSVPEGKRYVVVSHGDAWRLNGVWTGEPLIRLGALPGS